MCHRQPDLHLLWSLWLKLSFPLSPHLVFIWVVPTFVQHSTSLQIKFSLFFLCFFYLISYQFPLLPECSLLLFFVTSWLSTSSFHLVPISPTGSQSLPNITRSAFLPPCQEQTSHSLDIWLFFHWSHKCCYVTASESFSHFKHLLRPSYFIQDSQNAVSWTNFLLNTESSLQNNWMSNISLHWTWAESWPFLYSPRKD